MISDFGIYIRKIRSNKGDSLRDMAKKLNISPAFLSAMEVGKKLIPEDYIKKISDLYNLSIDEITQLKDSVALANKNVNLELDKMNDDQKEISFIFARKIQNADPDLIKKLKEALNDKN